MFTILITAPIDVDNLPRYEDRSILLYDNRFRVIITTHTSADGTGDALVTRTFESNADTYLTIETTDVEDQYDFSASTVLASLVNSLIAEAATNSVVITVDGAIEPEIRNEVFVDRRVSTKDIELELRKTDLQLDWLEKEGIGGAIRDVTYDDTQLRADLTQEVADREAGDDALDTRVTDLENSPGGTNEAEVNALIDTKVTEHNSDANAHETQFDGKVDLDGQNIPDANVPGWKVKLDIPDSAGMGISEADVDQKITDHDAAADAHDTTLLDVRGARLADNLTETEKTAILNKLNAAQELKLIDRDPRPFTTEMGFINVSGETGTKPLFSTRDDIASITVNSTVINIDRPKRNLITPPDFLTDIVAYQDSSSRWYVLYHKAVDVPQSHVIIIDDDESGRRAYLIRQTNYDTVTMELDNGETIEMERYEYEDDNSPDWPTSFNIDEDDPPTISLNQWNINGHTVESENLDAVDFPDETLAFRVISATNFRAVSAFYKNPTTSSWEWLTDWLGISGDLAEVEDEVAALDFSKANRDASNLQSFHRPFWAAYLGLSQYLNNRLSNLPTPDEISAGTRSSLLELFVGAFNPATAPNFVEDGILRVDGSDVVVDSSFTHRGDSGFFTLATPVEIRDRFPMVPTTETLGTFKGIARQNNTSIYIDSLGHTSDRADALPQANLYDWQGIGHLTQGHVTAGADPRLSYIAKLKTDTNFSIYFLDTNGDLVKDTIIADTENVLDIQTKGDYTYSLIKNGTDYFVGRKHTNDSSFSDRALTLLPGFIDNPVKLDVIDDDNFMVAFIGPRSTTMVNYRWGSSSNSIIFSNILDLPELASGITGLSYSNNLIFRVTEDDHSRLLAPISADRIGRMVSINTQSDEDDRLKTPGDTSFRTDLGTIRRYNGTDVESIAPDVRLRQVERDTSSHRLNLVSKLFHNVNTNTPPAKGVPRVKDDGSDMELDTGLIDDVESLKTDKEDKFLYGVRDPNKIDVRIGRGAHTLANDNAVLSTSASLNCRR